MKCANCHQDIKPNEGEARHEAPWVHRDGFIRCYRPALEREGEAQPAN